MGQYSNKKEGNEMTGIDILLEEHQVILQFTSLVRKMCCGILEGNEIDNDIFVECIDFGRNYADKHHHGKEEQILFRIMLEKLVPAADKLIRNGMFVEHDLGRYHLMELEKVLGNYKENPCTENKLDIIANAMGYVSLLERHIAKEDSVVYTFAKRSLSEDDKRKVDDETMLFEDGARVQGTQSKYLEWLKKAGGCDR